MKISNKIAFSMSQVAVLIIIMCSGTISSATEILFANKSGEFRNGDAQNGIFKNLSESNVELNGEILRDSNLMTMKPLSVVKPSPITSFTPDNLAEDMDQNMSHQEEIQGIQITKPIFPLSIVKTVDYKELDEEKTFFKEHVGGYDSISDGKILLIFEISKVIMETDDFRAFNMYVNDADFLMNAAIMNVKLPLLVKNCSKENSLMINTTESWDNTTNPVEKNKIRDNQLSGNQTQNFNAPCGPGLKLFSKLQAFLVNKTKFEQSFSTKNEEISSILNCGNEQREDVEKGYEQGKGDNYTIETVEETIKPNKSESPVKLSVDWETSVNLSYQCTVADLVRNEDDGVFIMIDIIPLIRLWLGEGFCLAKDRDLGTLVFALMIDDSWTMLENYQDHIRQQRKQRQEMQNVEETAKEYRHWGISGGDSTIRFEYAIDRKNICS